MFARVEVTMRPEFSDPGAQGFLRRLELAQPELRAQVRWARQLDVYWIDLEASREEAIRAITETYWDRVLQWLFTGNLIPSASGKSGSVQDLMQTAPHRPGHFWAIEKRLRPGVTDNVARTSVEAFEILLKTKLPATRVMSGSLILLEGSELREESLARIAKEVFANDLIETWTVYSESELLSSSRFNSERVKQDLPQVLMRPSQKVELYSLEGLGDEELQKLSQKRLWALSLAEMKAIQRHYSNPEEKMRRKELALPEAPTDVEMEVLAQTWSEHCKHKIFRAKINYKDVSGGQWARKDEGIPAVINSLFKKTITQTTAELPKSWLLSVFDDNAGIVALDDEDALCIKVETHNSPSALDPYGGALTGIVGVNRDILGCGYGAKPIANTNVFCLAPPEMKGPYPDRLLPPRRILEGVRRGVEHGGNKSGIPTVNGALYFDARYIAKPLVYCGTIGIMPREIGGRRCETKEVKVRDRICMVGGRIGKDGIHGATFSSMALDQNSPSSAVQLGDPITQKRMSDFLLEARNLGLYRAITDNGAGGLSSSVGEMARLSGGARMDVARAKTKVPGLRPFELVVSESQERMTVAVPPENLRLFMQLAERRGAEVSDLGEFTDSGLFEIWMDKTPVAALSLEFLHEGTPELVIEAAWSGITSTEKMYKNAEPFAGSFEKDAPAILLKLLSRPNIASKEWLIRQYDHEVQGMSVIKPLHTVAAGTAIAFSGPNDGAVLKPKAHSMVGIAVGSGLQPRYSDFDAYLMAQASVDEAVRNVLCVGAEYGRPDSLLALVDNFCWPDPIPRPEIAADLVRACYGLREAALALGTPFISGKDSMKNEYRGKLSGNSCEILVPPTLLVTALGRVPEIQNAKSADFKGPGDLIYLVGGRKLGLLGSEFGEMQRESKQALPQGSKLPEPNWTEATAIYSWLGGSNGIGGARVRSVHDVSDGGVLCAVTEGILARGWGAVLQFPGSQEPWELAFGEGFHSFIVTVAEGDAMMIEEEFHQFGVPFYKLGRVVSTDTLEVRFASHQKWSLPVRQLRQAWKPEGYWE